MTKTSRQYAQLQHKLIDIESIIWVDSVRDQLETFEKLASSVIVLPGGYGTFLELFYFLTFGCQNGCLSDRLETISYQGIC